MNTGLLILGYVDRPDRRTSLTSATDECFPTQSLSASWQALVITEDDNSIRFFLRWGWFLDGSFYLLAATPTIV